MGRPPIYKLPPETLWGIFNQIDDVTDLKSLLLVSKPFHEAVIPIIYQTIAPLQREYHMFDLPFSIASLDSISRNSKWVKAVILEATFHRDCIQRCPHSLGSRAMDDFSDNLVDFFQRLEDDRLREFSWNLGTCVPSRVLGERGCLPTQQKKLKHLSLKTDPRCDSADYVCLGLSQLKSLQSFSWIGLRSARDFVALRDCFRENAPRIETLMIDLGDWNEAEVSWRRHLGRVVGSPNFFAEEILEIDPGQRSRRFHVLQSLSLCSVSFHSEAPNMIPEIIQVLNFHGLHTLKLWNCLDMFALLETLAISVNQVMRLTHLELVADHLDPIVPFTNYDKPLCGFLQSFQGLTNLYIMCPSPIDSILHGINHHGTTLKSLVLHQRLCDYDEASPLFEHPCDDQIHWSDEVKSVFRNRNLEILGVSTWPCVLRSALAKISPRPQYKILHVRSSRFNNENLADFSGYSDDEMGDIRREADDAAEVIDTARKASGGGTGEESEEDESFSEPHLADDFRELAQWAFGPSGLPELSLLAYGDFSHQGRYKRHTMLLCRDELPEDDAIMKGPSSELPAAPCPIYYRHLRPDDLQLHEFYRRHEDSLAACNVANVMVERGGSL